MDPKVAIVVPVIETENREYWRQFAKSVEEQTFGAENILLVYVIRFRASCATPINPKGSTVRVLPLNLPQDHSPTPMEQAGLGFQYVYDTWPNVQYMVAAPANDVLDPGFVKDLRFALTADAKVQVSIPDFWYCKEDMAKVKIHRFNDKLVLNHMLLGNFIPDMSMVRRETYAAVPFDSRHGRAAFWIWWIRIFRHFGPFAFSFTRQPLFYYRQHKGQTSGNKEFVLDGTKRFTEWAHAEGLIPKEIIIRPKEEPEIVNLEDNETRSDHNSTD